jgi:hypothetical protein
MPGGGEVFGQPCATLKVNLSRIGSESVSRRFSSAEAASLQSSSAGVGASLANCTTARVARTSLATSFAVAFCDSKPC